MGLLLLWAGYLATIFVLVVQPVRILWGLYLLVKPPEGRYLNRAVLALSLFIKVMSLIMAGYFVTLFSTGGEYVFGPSSAKLMIPPFTIYIMSELVARFIHRRSDEQI